MRQVVRHTGDLVNGPLDGQIRAAIFPPPQHVKIPDLTSESDCVAFASAVFGVANMGSRQLFGGLFGNTLRVEVSDDDGASWRIVFDRVAPGLTAGYQTQFESLPRGPK